MARATSDPEQGIDRDRCLIAESNTDGEIEGESSSSQCDMLHHGHQSSKYGKLLLVATLLLSALAGSLVFAGHHVDASALDAYTGEVEVALAPYTDLSGTLSHMTTGTSWPAIAQSVDLAMSGAGCASASAQALCNFLFYATPADRDVIVDNLDIASNLPGRVTTTFGPPPVPGAEIPASWPSAAGLKYAPACKPYPGKRVIFLTVNFEFIDMFRNWLHYARAYVNDSTEQIVVYPEDGPAAASLQNMSINASPPFEVANPNDYASKARRMFDYGTPQYATLVKERPILLHNLLARDCSVLYVDVDTVWRKPVFPAIAKQGTHSLYVPIDDGRDNLCTDLLYMHPVESVKKLMLDWDQRCKNSHFGMNQPHFNQAILHSTVDFTRLPHREFPNGYDVDANQVWYGVNALLLPKNASFLNTAVMLHANYRVGLAAKIAFFTSYGAWSR